MSQRAQDLLSARTASRGAALFLWRQALRAGRWQLLTGLGAASLAGLCGAGFMLVLAQLLALALTQPENSGLLHILLASGVVLLALRAGLAFIAERHAQHAAARARVNLRHDLYQQLLERGPVLGRLTPIGEIITTLMERVEACDGYIARYLPQLAAALTVPPLILIAVSCHDVVSGLILLACGALLPVFLAITGIAAGRASSQQMQALARLSGLFHDRIRHLATLRTFNAVERESRQLHEAAQDFRQRTMSVLRLAFLSAGMLDLFFMLALALVAIHVFSQPYSLGMQIGIVLLVNEFFAPLRALSASYHDRAAALAAVQGMETMLEPVRHGEQGRRPAPSPLRQPSLELQHVSYTYPGRVQAALDNVSLRVEGSEFLAIAGASGAGKSTMLNLLMGFIEPQQGMLFLAGQPLHLINPAERTAAFAWVGQRNHLFYGTLADNIRLGRPEAGEVEILKAAQAAHLGDLLNSLPNGLETLIGERGFGLSGGQAQRVALARAFLRDAPVLLLDEPTAGLDHATSVELMLTIRKLAEGRTVVMVSHDPVALQAAERVIRLGEGT